MNIIMSKYNDSFFTRDALRGNAFNQELSIKTKSKMRPAKE